MSNLLTKTIMSVHLLFSHHSPWVIVGAFSGSIVFIISSNDFTSLVRLVLFSTSMMIGIISSDCLASILSALISRNFDMLVAIPPEIGATITSATAVRLLMMLEAHLTLITTRKKNNGD